MARLFIAIDLPEALASELGSLVPPFPGARFVPREQIHLTLSFLGEVAPEAQRELEPLLVQVTLPAFALTVRGGGVFPDRRRPHVLWAGVDASPALLQLRAAIEEAVQRVGLPAEEKPFHPHVTLARLKGPRRSEVERSLAALARFTAAPFMVRNFRLYSSVLSESGAVHKVERELPLAPAPG
jgi:2'-5' RNA ligase